MGKNAISKIRVPAWLGMAAGVVIVFLVSVAVGRQLGVGRPENFPELKTLAAKNLDFPQMSKFFTRVARQKGAVYAFALLKAAPSPAGIDMHLMGHIVGDELYKQKGVAGMQYCTDDFRNACSHALVVGLFMAKGEAALPEIAAACRSAPGGRGAYTMCFHGLGHGILSAVQYDLPRAVGLCQKTRTAAANYQEGPECVGGAIMETISGGFHDREVWQREVPKYFRADNPLYPCDSDLIPDDARQMCMTYLTPHLLRTAGADLGSPRAEDFVKAFSYCNRLPVTDIPNRQACFGGFGKEFLVLVKDRDIRKQTQLTDRQLVQIVSWCGLTADPSGSWACLKTAADSMFWGGENDYHPVLRFCGQLPTAGQKRECQLNLISNFAYYQLPVTSRRQLCEQLAGDYQQDCRKRLGL